VIRSKIILYILSGILFGSLTITDTHHLFIEQEEVAEGRELEREELKEKEEGKDWLENLLSSSDSEADQSNWVRFNFAFSTLNQNQGSTSNFSIQNVALFILFCSLKIDC
jgi:hypothetical protein